MNKIVTDVTIYTALVKHIITRNVYQDFISVYGVI